MTMDDPLVKHMVKMGYLIETNDGKHDLGKRPPRDEDPECVALYESCCTNVVSYLFKFYMETDENEWD